MKNVILLTIDALRKDVFGCYGCCESCTPFMDSIQKNCLRFTDDQSAGPYTQASFPAILTSSYFLEYGKQKTLHPKKTLISQVLKEKGITTAAFHSSTYLSYYFGYNRGWDKFYDSMQESVSDMYPFIKGSRINSMVKEWLESHTANSKNNPFFLWTHYMDVHEPYLPEKKYVDRVDSSIKMEEKEIFDMFKNVILERDVSDIKKVEIQRKFYKAKVIEMDEYVKEFFGNLDELGLLDNTIVIITSDHGEEFGEHGGLSHDGKMYGELIDVPLFIFDKDISEEKIFERPVSSVDISPTIANLLEAEIPQKFTGIPLLPLESYDRIGCYGEAMDKRGRKEKDTDKPIYYYRENNLKLIYQSKGNRWELYDLKNDTAEKNNLGMSHPDFPGMQKKLLDTIKKYKKN